MLVVPVPLSSARGAEQGTLGLAAGVGAGRAAGCWETSLLSSDKNSSILKARGRAVLPAAQGMRLHPLGACSRGGVTQLRGVCAQDPPPHTSVVTGCRGMVVDRLRVGAGVAQRCPLPLDWSRKGVNRNWGWAGVGGLRPPPLLPLPLWLITCCLSPEERVGGEARWVGVPSLAQRWGVSLRGFCCPIAAGLGGSGGTSPSRGGKTLLPFLAASVGFTALASIAVKTLLVPSLGSSTGGWGSGLHPLPFFMGRA